MDGYDDEIDEIINYKDFENLKEKKINYFDNLEKYAKYYFKEKKNNMGKEEKQKFDELRKAYYDKREAIIEASLRKVKKIVNDEKEYEIFENEYYNIEMPKNN